MIAVASGRRTEGRSRLRVELVDVNNKTVTVQRLPAGSTSPRPGGLDLDFGDRDALAITRQWSAGGRYDDRMGRSELYFRSSTGRLRTLMRFKGTLDAHACGSRAVVLIKPPRSHAFKAIRVFDRSGGLSLHRAAPRGGAFFGLHCSAKFAVSFLDSADPWWPGEPPAYDGFRVFELSKLGR
ncbi:MAG: hypothetical protein WAP35_09805 [Solirubrobacterales bacterium]